jgi:hypothetical protein
MANSNQNKGEMLHEVPPKMNSQFIVTHDEHSSKCNVTSKQVGVLIRLRFGLPNFCYLAYGAFTLELSQC